MPATAIPFPSMPSSQSVLDKTLFNNSEGGDSYDASDLAPLNIYVMAGQTWDIGVAFTNGGAYQNAVSTSSAQTDLADNIQEIENNMGFQIFGLAN